MQLKLHIIFVLYFFFVSTSVQDSLWHLHITWDSSTEFIVLYLGNNKSQGQYQITNLQ